MARTMPARADGRSGLGTRFAGLAIAFALGGAGVMPLQAQSPPPAPSTSPRPFTVDDVLAVVTVDDVQLSPDGKVVAYVATSRDLEENAQNSEIWKVASDGGAPVRLTHHPKADVSPRWSPDSTRLAFLSGRTEKDQIWTIDPRGGEPVKLTNHKERISGFAWAPDGKSIAFLAVEPRTDEAEKRIKDRWVPRVVGEDLRSTVLWRIDVESRTVRQLTTSARHVSSVDWAPDGSRLVFSAATSSDLLDADTADLFVVSRDGGEVKKIGGFSSADTQPKWSPDGKRILFSSRGDREGTAWNSQLHALDAANGSIQPLTSGFDESASGAEWAADGATVYFTAGQKTQRHVFAAPGTPLTRGRFVFGDASFDRSGRTAAFVRQAPGVPSDVYIADVKTLDAPRKLTDINPQIRDLAQGEQEVVTWTNGAGQTVEGILVKPVGYRKGTRYPLLAVIHGGPAGVDADGFIHRKSAYPVQVFAGKGYATLLVNYRGSTGYGEQWLKGNVGSLGAHEFDDIETGIDALIASGVADADRLGFMGWSYGGHMTYWAVTHSTRFKAASSGAGATNLISMYGQTDIPQFYTKTYFGKAPWDDFDFYVKHSSFFKVGAVKTPTLIQYGENDARVPVPQGFEFHRALKERGVPTQLVIYPGQGHGIVEPRFQKDLLQRNVDWFDKWLLGATGAKPSTSTAASGGKEGK